MGKLRHGSLCTRCSEGKVHRIRRHGWMRRLPDSKHYSCEACRTRFLTLFGWAIRLPKKPAAKDKQADN